MTQLTSEQVWQEVEKQMFAVLGMVTAEGQARTVGIVYVAHDRTIYISSQKSAWKTRHIAQNPHVSLTVPIHKHIPLMPWIKIPAATITFAGQAIILAPGDLSAEIVHKLYRGVETDAGLLQDTAVIKVVPVGEFITYGVGVSLMDMRIPEKARGRAAVI